MSVQRVYDPPECDANGVPLDWECCRTCGGAGEVQYSTTPNIDPRDPRCETREDPCGVCGGFGSLKAAALAMYWDDCGEDRSECGCHAGECEIAQTVRCEDCSHPMSEGTWEGAFGDEVLRADLLRKPYGDLHRWAERMGLVHYSASKART